jgi:hypothetical protein
MFFAHLLLNTIKSIYLGRAGSQAMNSLDLPLSGR